MDPMVRSAATEANLTRALWALTAGTFALALNLNVLAPLLPDIARAFDASPETLGLLSAMYAVPQALGAPLLGPLSDRWGRRRMMLLALGGFTLAGFAAALAPTLAWLAVARVLAGLASSIYVPAAYAWIGDQVPAEHRAAGISNMTMAAPLASMVILPLAGFMDVQFGWRSPFILLALLALLALWPISSIPDGHRRVRGGPGLVASYREILSVPGAPTLLLASLCFAVSIMGPTAFLGVYLVEVHLLSIATAGIVLGVLSAARLFGNRVGARFADRLGHRRAVTWGLAGMAIGYLLVGLPGLPLGMALAGLALVGATFQGGYPAQVALVIGLSPAARGGTAAAANTGLFYLGATIGPALVGLAVGAAGPISVGWIGLLGALVGLALVTTRARVVAAVSRARGD